MKNKSPLVLILLFFFANSVLASTYGVQIKANHCKANQALPDYSCTPGGLLTTDASVICVSGYTKTVRNVPLKERKQVFAEYGIPYSFHSKYEVDHLISLELGGSNDISNLWPEPYNIKSGARIKDKFENYLHSQVCRGQMSIDKAQAEISNDWLRYYSVTAAKTPKTEPTVSNNPATSSTTNNASPSIESPSAPQGATAKCNDGTFSFSQHHSGTCSHHGGVVEWFQ